MNKKLIPMRPKITLKKTVGSFITHLEVNGNTEEKLVKRSRKESQVLEQSLSQI